MSNQKCVCGKSAERFKEHEGGGVVAIVNGAPCCSAFGGRRYQGLDLSALVIEFNSRPTDLGVECGAL